MRVKAVRARLHKNKINRGEDDDEMKQKGTKYNVNVLVYVYYTMMSLSNVMGRSTRELTSIVENSSHSLTRIYIYIFYIRTDIIGSRKKYCL